MSRSGHFRDRCRFIPFWNRSRKSSISPCSQHAVLCRAGTGTLELITPAVVMVALALAGLAVGIYAVIAAAQRA